MNASPVAPGPHSIPYLVVATCARRLLETPASRDSPSFRVDVDPVEVDPVVLEVVVVVSAAGPSGPALPALAK